MTHRQSIEETLVLNPDQEIDRISQRLVELLRVMKRKGLVIGISGGIDSSVTLALAVKALGRERVLALQMPERHSAEETLYLSNMLADTFAVERIHEDISKTLEAVKFYKRYEEAVRQVIPEYTSTWKSKIVIPSVVDNPGYTVFSIIAENPAGETIKKRLPLQAYLGIVAATNFKQRIRKMFEYYHADCLNFAVAGTPNRLEYDQGFFVKLGDGAADIKPIAHLYKTQVYQLAEYLGVPEEIRRRPPTTDTYSLPQGQDEFYFSLAHDKMDICLYAKNHDIPAADVAREIGLSEEQVERVFKDIDTKRSTTSYLHMSPQLITDIDEIAH
ncbi:NAD(+) synthase [Desulfofustis glycolicus]|uniref:NH(3)-dependent NAD(+) synthetase n=1 Tax=Desulfofustis glycolicus DSM 9705 TaxID=1121409 RepID=A0A1M5W9C5_9BACT|nr:NAD(+) synthase [Desulfofustis glycolicus]SHH84179.1 NH(3)-dependent NAD(+) synthetase [Desulfofustis glycolicus DSM 9705]